VIAAAAVMTAILIGYPMLVAPALSVKAPPSATPKYIFIFLADGGGLAQLELTRQYSQHVHNAGLVITDKIMKEGTVGLMTTHAANSLSTDSAAAATALACGCKAKIGMLGICEDGSQPKSALELAKANGMRIGLITNAAVYDATPAAFSTHLSGRSKYSEIIDQYLRLEPDILMGGGRNVFLPAVKTGSRRWDLKDMIGLFEQKGYTYVSKKAELLAAGGPKILGLFSMEEMSFEIDRDQSVEPSIYDMTAAAIRSLREHNSRGFAVLIESENIDSAAHWTDVASLVRDFREFDRAVGLAYEFYRAHPAETLILIVSDHDTGGLGLIQGLKDLRSTRDSNRAVATPVDLKKIESIPISLKRASEILGPNPTAASIDHLMETYFKGFSLAPDFKEQMIKRQPFSRSIFSDPIKNGLGMMVANNTQAYWLTTAHTHQPVFVAALGTGADKFGGYQDNAEFGKKLRNILEHDARGRQASGKH
jgi:alkaline phosphatase